MDRESRESSGVNYTGMADKAKTYFELGTSFTIPECCVKQFIVENILDDSFGIRTRMFDGVEYRRSMDLGWVPCDSCIIKWSGKQKPGAHFNAFTDEASALAGRFVDLLFQIADEETKLNRARDRYERSLKELGAAYLVPKAEMESTFAEAVDSIRANLARIKMEQYNLKMAFDLLLATQAVKEHQEKHESDRQPLKIETALEAKVNRAAG